MQLITDMFRMIFVQMFDSVGYDYEIMLLRTQMGIAIYMTPGFLPFF